MDEFSVANIDANVRKAVASRVEEDEIATFEFGLLYGLPEPGHLARLSWQLQAQRFLGGITYEAAAIEALFRRIAAKAIVDAEIGERGACEAARLGTSDLFLSRQVCTQRVGSHIAQIRAGITIAYEQGRRVKLVGAGEFLAAALGGAACQNHARRYDKGAVLA